MLDFLDFLIFGFLDVWIFSFWILGPVDIWTPKSVFPCTVGARLDNATIHICTIYTYMYMCMNTHHWLNHAFAVAKGYLANRMMVHCLVPVLKNDDKKGPGYTSITTSSKNSNIHSTVY